MANDIIGTIDIGGLEFEDPHVTIPRTDAPKIFHQTQYDRTALEIAARPDVEITKPSLLTFLSTNMINPKVVATLQDIQNKLNAGEAVALAAEPAVKKAISDILQLGIDALSSSNLLFAIPKLIGDITTVVGDAKAISDSVSK